MAIANPLGYSTMPPPLHAGRAVRGCVLLVEDDDIIRDILKELLEEQDLTVLAAASAEAALPLLQSARQIDVLVSDVRLPGMDGTTLADMAVQRHPQIKVMLMSGYASHLFDLTALNAAGMQLVLKPFDLDVFVFRVLGMIS